MRVENICNAKPIKIRIKINTKKEVLTLEIFIFDRQISNLFVHLFQIRIHFGFWNELLSLEDLTFLTRLNSKRQKSCTIFIRKFVSCDLDSWHGPIVEFQIKLNTLLVTFSSQKFKLNQKFDLFSTALHCCRSTLCFEFQGNKNR